MSACNFKNYGYSVGSKYDSKYQIMASLDISLITRHVKFLPTDKKEIQSVNTSNKY